MTRSVKSFVLTRYMFRTSLREKCVRYRNVVERARTSHDKEVEGMHNIVT